MRSIVVAVSAKNEKLARMLITMRTDVLEESNERKAAGESVDGISVVVVLVVVFESSTHHGHTSFDA